jgi:predicted esterase
MSMIGFSQGTTVLQYAMAELPELFKKVTNVVGLIAPCGVMDTT